MILSFFRWSKRNVWMSPKVLFTMYRTILVYKVQTQLGYLVFCYWLANFFKIQIGVSIKYDRMRNTDVIRWTFWTFHLCNKVQDHDNLICYDMLECFYSNNSKCFVLNFGEYCLEVVVGSEVSIYIMIRKYHVLYKWTVLGGQLVSQRECIAIPFSLWTADNPVSRRCQTIHERTNGRTDRQCSNLRFALALNEPLRNN